MEESSEMVKHRLHDKIEAWLRENVNHTCV